MGKVALVAIVAALVGAGIVYGVMLYLGRAPLTLDEVIAEVPDRMRGSEEPMPSARGQPMPTTRPAATVPSATTHPAAVATPSPEPVATFESAPTVEPLVDPLTEQDAVVHAFASCGGQYSGEEMDFRARAATSAIADGRQTVSDVRALAVEHCGGVPSNVAPAPVFARNTPAPMATAVPTQTAAPAHMATAHLRSSWPHLLT